MKREPNGLDAAAYVGMKIAEYASYGIIGLAIAIGWGITP